MTKIPWIETPSSVLHFC